LAPSIARRIERGTCISEKVWEQEIADSIMIACERGQQPGGGNFKRIKDQHGCTQPTTKLLSW